MPASSLAWKTSRKSQDAVALRQIERGALPMIDRGDIRQAIDRCSNIWASLLGAGYGQFEHKADSLIAKFKEAGKTVREIDTEQSHRDYLRSGYLHVHIVCLSWAVNHYRDNACPPTKPSRQKCQRTEAGERGNYWHADADQRDVAALVPKYTKELADAKAENGALRDDVAAGRRRLHIKAVCQSVREATALRRDGLASRLADTWTGYFIRRWS